MTADIRPIRSGGAMVYKLTDQNMQTHNGYQWVLGRKQQTSGAGPLCAAGWLHAYSHPIIALMLNPIHGSIASPRLFEAHARGVYLSDRSLKVGVSEMTLMEEMSVSQLSVVDTVVWAIFVVRSIPDRALIPVWEEWADTVLAAGVLVDARAATNAARAAAHAAAYATDAAYAAARAATDAADAAYATAHAAYAAAHAARIATDATDAVAPLSLLQPTYQFLAWQKARS